MSCSPSVNKPREDVQHSPDAAVPRGPLVGQTTSTIEGTVTDKQGLAVSGAQVRVEGSTAAATRSVTTENERRISDSRLAGWSLQADGHEQQFQYAHFRRTGTHAESHVEF